jgi:hypothetical protein
MLVARGLTMIDPLQFYTPGSMATSIDWWMFEYARALEEEINHAPDLLKFRKLNDISNLCVLISKAMERTVRGSKFSLDSIPVKLKHAQFVALSKAVERAFVRRMSACAECTNSCLVDLDGKTYIFVENLKVVDFLDGKLPLPPLKNNRIDVSKFTAGDKLNIDYFFYEMAIEYESLINHSKRLAELRRYISADQISEFCAGAALHDRKRVQDTREGIQFRLGGEYTYNFSKLMKITKLGHNILLELEDKAFKQMQKRCDFCNHKCWEHYFKSTDAFDRIMSSNRTLVDI